MKKVLAALGTAAVLMTGATACGTQTQDQGYEYVWDHGHYTYVPYDYYQSHRSYYNGAHKPKHVSSHYVTTHHVTVTHKTTTTVHKDGSRTTTRHSTTHRSTTRKSSGFGGSRTTRRR